MDKMMYAIVSLQRNNTDLIDTLVPLQGITGNKLQIIAARDIAAVVSDFIPSDIIAGESQALAYGGIIDLLARHVVLLPMRFGSAMQSDDLVTKMLERNYEDIRKNLDKVENRDEFGLKVLFTQASAPVEKQMDPAPENDTPNPGAAGNKNSIFADYVKNKLAIHREEEKTMALMEAVKKEIMDCMINISAMCKIKKTTSSHSLIDAVILVGKEQKTDLVSITGKLQEQHPGLKMILTGPWPPYSFVDFIIK